MLEASMPATISNRLHILTFVFPFVKIIMREQLYPQLIRLVAYIYFCFSTCKNCNAGAAMPAAGIPAAV